MSDHKIGPGLTRLTRSVFVDLMHQEGDFVFFALGQPVLGVAHYKCHIK